MKEHTDKVSIIIATAGKRLRELEEAITSALQQDYANIEVLVVSDGPSQANKVIAKYSDDRLRLIEAEHWGDPVRIREVGIEACSGCYICFLDDDDLLYPNHVSTLIEHASAGIVAYSRATYVIRDAKGKVTKTNLIEPNNPDAPYYKIEAIYNQNIAPISCFLLNKEMHYAIGGFDKNLVRLEDWDYWARLSFKYEFRFVDIITNEIRVNQGAISRTYRNDIFKDTNSIVGKRIKERLLYMKQHGVILLNDEVRKAVCIPKVSVVMPVYNSAEYVREAIDSILNQTFEDYELIIVDDGSTDGSEKIVDEYLRDRRVRVFHKKNEGVTKTLNFGLAQSIGRYIARMDSDDVSMPDRLRLQVEFLDNNRQVGLLGTRFKAYHADGRFIENLDVELTNAELQPKLLESCRFGHPTIMMRRSVLEDLGAYDESQQAYTVEDYDLWLRIAEKYEVANLPQYLLNYRISPNQITQKKRAQNQLATKACIQLAKRRRGLMSNTLVSVCIPAYKDAEKLKRAIDSTLIQSHGNFELIITDDSPDDSVRGLVQSYETDVRIKYFANERRLGSPENWNEAIRRASGEYIKILHHDDYFTDRYALAKFVAMLDDDSHAAFAFSGCMNIDAENESVVLHKAKTWQVKRLVHDPDFLFGGNFVGAPSVTIFRRNCLMEFDRQFKWVVDMDFYIRILRANPYFTYTVEPLITISVNSSAQVTASCINSKSVLIGEYLRMYEKNCGTSPMKIYHIKYLWKDFNLYNVKTTADIRACGFNGVIPREIFVMMKIQNIKLLMAPALLIEYSRQLYLICLMWLTVIIARNKR
jgi:glycosyltransferase involved in cell wall biosynthesis